MRRVILVVMMLFMCLFIGGCANQKTGLATVEAQTNIEGSDLLGVTPDASKIFSNKIQVYDDLSGNTYGFYILEADKSVYDTYVEECERTAFTIKQYNIDSGASGNTYQAFTADKKYKLDINYVATGKYVMITVTRK